MRTMSFDCYTTRGDTSVKCRKLRALGLYRGPLPCPECSVRAHRESLDRHIAARHPKSEEVAA